MNSPDDEAPPPVPPRDPLMDDPLFAEIVEPKPQKPVYAEPVEAAAEELPVAELAPVPVRAKATPVQPVAPNVPAVRPAPPMPVPVETEPPKPKWFMACGVIGCLGVFVIAAVAALIWIFITLLGGLGDKLSEQPTSKEAPSFQVQGVYSMERPGPIEPTSLAQSTTLKLPGLAGSVSSGANGRYLLIGIPSRRTIEAFDANTGAIVRSFPVDEPSPAFAAGSSKLFVYHRVAGAGKLVRFDLLSGAREFEAPMPKGIVADALAMGPGSEGPLYAISATPGAPGNQTRVTSFQTGSLAVIETLNMTDWRVTEARHVLPRCSFDGEQLGAAGADGGLAVRPAPIPRLALPARSLLLKSSRGSTVLASPSPDGTFFYTPRGVFDLEGRQLYNSSAFTFPTAQGSGLYVSLTVQNENVTGSPRIHAAGDSVTTPLITLSDIEIEGDIPAYLLKSLTLPANQRVHVWPLAGLVAVIPVGNNELQLYKVDFAKELRNSSRDFLAFVSDPVTRVKASDAYHYTPKLFSRTGAKPNLVVERGPPGMRVDGDSIVWPRQPADFAPDVVIRATTKSATAQQRFAILVE